MSDPSRVTIVPYDPRHAQAFRDLDLAWIARFFTVEAKDREQLESPETTIIASGGAVLMAKDEEGRAVGCVSLPARKQACSNSPRRR